MLAANPIGKIPSHKQSKGLGGEIMDHRETKKQTPPSLLPTTTTTTFKDESPRKLQPCKNISSNNICVGGDRIKRDEWSEGAVSTLLEEYEAKWILRNRAKLKGHDWEDVAKNVSCRAHSTKSPKTQTQCKNKIESMKKRYRSESASSDPSSWPLFPRLDLLLRGTAPPPPPAPPLMLIEPLLQSPPAQPLQQPPPLPPAVPITVAPSPSTFAPVATLPIHLGVAQNSFESNGVDHRINKEDGMDTKIVSDKNDTETDSRSSTPALYNDNDREKMKDSKRKKKKKKRGRRGDGEECEIADSIRLFAQVMVRSEKAKVDTMRELEKMRTEAEVKRSEMELKRTEMIANTQLEIARLFAGVVARGVDPSLRIGRS